MSGILHMLDIKQWLELGLQAATAAGVVPAVMRWLSVGRRARTASLVAQLAQEAMIAVARRRGVAPADVSHSDEAAEVLSNSLKRVGIDPSKVEDIARNALAGASHPDLAAEARRALQDKPLLPPQ